MENFARRDYKRDIDDKVKQELEYASIPIIKLIGGYNTGEVKTHYIGYLNGFVFQRAWTYWIVQGLMPMSFAKKIYNDHKELNIRAGGHCGNVPPEEMEYDLNYNKRLNEFFKIYNVEDAIRYSKDLKSIDIDPKYVNCYHIDTIEGLRIFADFIKENDIQTEIYQH